MDVQATSGGGVPGLSLTYCDAREQFLALLMSSHNRCGADRGSTMPSPPKCRLSENSKSNVMAIRVVWEFICECVTRLAVAFQSKDTVGCVKPLERLDDGDDDEEEEFTVLIAVSPLLLSVMDIRIEHSSCCSHHSGLRKRCYEHWVTWNHCLRRRPLDPDQVDGDGGIMERYYVHDSVTGDDRTVCVSGDNWGDGLWDVNGKWLVRICGLRMIAFYLEDDCHTESMWKYGSRVEVCVKPRSDRRYVTRVGFSRINPDIFTVVSAWGTFDSVVELVDVAQTYNSWSYTVLSSTYFSCGVVCLLALTRSDGRNVFLSESVMTQAWESKLHFVNMQQEGASEKSKPKKLVFNMPNENHLSLVNSSLFCVTFANESKHEIWDCNNTEQGPLYVVPHRSIHDRVFASSGFIFTESPSSSSPPDNEVIVTHVHHSNFVVVRMRTHPCGGIRTRSLAISSVVSLW
ncbi:hypothetical protein Pelo_7008 [Pelomyxa schiedti]|nr:hypothetical protein Pelo_7008 [Pelomyxa schiedti]